MKRIVLLLIMLFSLLIPSFAGSGLTLETMYRSKSGEYRSSLGSGTYKGTELEFLATSKSIVDDFYAFTFFGGFTKALSYAENDIGQDVSSIPLGWFYGVGNAILVYFSDGTQAEVSVGYDSAYLEYNGGESRVDHLRIGLRFNQTSYEGLQFSLGFEYSKPLWGRAFNPAFQDGRIFKSYYTGSAFAVSVGVGYQSW